MERTEQRELPGNDASWYREMIADLRTAKSAAVELESEGPPVEPLGSMEEAAEKAPSEEDAGTAPIETKVASTATNRPPDESLEGTGDPGDDTPAATALAPLPVTDDDGPLENTSEMVGQLWTARDSYGPLDDWEPGEIDRKVGSARSFRWTTLIGLVAIIGLIVTGLVILPSITQRRADSYRQSISEPLHALRAELPDAQTSLAIATDPASNGAALADLTTQLTTFAAKASAVDAATQADPPAAPPFTSTAPIDEVEPVRQQAEPLGAAAITIQRRIANLVEYRTLMSGFLVLSELPTAADNDTQATLRVDLAAAQAESAAILADLPDDVALESHNVMAREINERFATWQVDYLEALRTNDAADAAALIAELETSLAELENALVTPLAEIRRETDTDLIDLAREIDTVTAMADTMA